jgi:hypothetical protein
MQTELLNDALRDLFKEVDRLAERHREALEYVAASERTAFLHTQMQSLRQTLSELRAAAALVRSIRGDRSGEELWRQTCADLRSHAPPDLLAPGRALVAGSLDLLQLVEYTGASAALARERRDHLVGQIAQGLMQRQRAMASPIALSSDPSETIRLIHQAIAQISESGGALRVDDVVREQGWVE